MLHAVAGEEKPMSDLDRAKARMKLCGIGVRYIQAGDQAFWYCLPGSPAQEAGFLDGDLFISIDGEDASALAPKDILDKLRGNPESIVAVQVKRGDGFHKLSIKRTRFSLPVMILTGIDKGIGTIQLISFAKPGKKDHPIQVLDDLIQKHRIKALVIDANRFLGGNLTQINEFADALSDKDKRLYSTITAQSTKGREETLPEQVYMSTAERKWQLPVMVVTEPHTTEMGELLASALQSGNNRVVGVRTSGRAKNVMRSFDKDGNLKISGTQQYIKGDGTPLTGQGIIPDVEVTGSREQINRRAVAELEKSLSIRK
jgi:carboxyl-terminal processing protease